MRPSLLLLLTLLLFLSLGTASSSTYVGCGTAGVGGVAFFGCSSGSGEDACDYIVTLQVTVLLAADNSPIAGATVYVDSGPPDAVNTRVTDPSGQAHWRDTSFLTGFSTICEGEEVGTVEPYDAGTAFNYNVLVSVPGLAPGNTVITIDRQTRDVALEIRLFPL